MDNIISYSTIKKQIKQLKKESDILDSSNNLSLTILFENITEKSIQQFFHNPAYINRIMHRYCKFVDSILISLFPKIKNVSLIAIGGYGRQELYPYSDIDILIITDQISSKQTKAIQNFMQEIWSSGIKVGHSVRDKNAVLNDAKEDLHLLTALCEARFIAGEKELFNQLIKTYHLHPPISQKEFLYRKVYEQYERDLKYPATLEPNIKKTIGNLRYIHIILWLINYCCNFISINKLVKAEIITSNEYNIIKDIHKYFSQIRFALHAFANRAEDRLLYQYQKKIAELFGYNGVDSNINIENFMQNYYKSSQQLMLLNRIILGLMQEKLFIDNTERPIRSLNFYLIAKSSQNIQAYQYYIKKPEKIIESFIFLSEQRAQKFLNPYKIRNLQVASSKLEHKKLIHNDKVNLAFMRFISKGKNLARQFKYLLSIGFLEKYIPEFKVINGKMQFDLYHKHTVDQHIFKVIAIMQKMAEGDYKQKFTLIHEVFLQLKTPHLLYLSGLFHDIGKGSGKEHSLQGAVIMTKFAENLKLNTQDIELLSWLVESHLLMSRITKKEDIYSMKVITKFAQLVKNIDRLNYLFLLTVADIKGTNPNLWTDWQSTLLTQLYLATKSYFLGSQQQELLYSHIKTAQESIDTTLSRLHLDHEFEQKLRDNWHHWPAEYFNNTAFSSIKWHINNILFKLNSSDPIVFARFNHRLKQSEITIYSAIKQYLFANVTAGIDALNLQIVDAKVYSFSNSFSLSSYIVTDESGSSITSTDDIKTIAYRLSQDLKTVQTLKQREVRLGKLQLYQDQVPTKVSITPKKENHLMITIKTIDRQGLLADIAYTIAELNLIMEYAKINTLDEKVEDNFFVYCNDTQLILNKNYLEIIKQKILNSLNLD